MSDNNETETKAFNQILSELKRGNGFKKINHDGGIIYAISPYPLTSDGKKIVYDFKGKSGTLPITRDNLVFVLMKVFNSLPGDFLKDHQIIEHIN